jgi:hypothetical protein
MSQPTLAGEEGLSWRVARACNGGACLRVAPKGGMIILGDSKDPAGAVLRSSHSTWLDFVAGIKHGDFDRL